MSIRLRPTWPFVRCTRPDCHRLWLMEVSDRWWSGKKPEQPPRSCMQSDSRLRRFAKLGKVTGILDSLGVLSSMGSGSSRHAACRPWFRTSVVLVRPRAPGRNALLFGKPFSWRPALVVPFLFGGSSVRFGWLGIPVRFRLHRSAASNCLHSSLRTLLILLVPPVSTLVKTTTARVLEVRPDEAAWVLDREVKWDMGRSTQTALRCARITLSLI